MPPCVTLSPPYEGGARGDWRRGRSRQATPARPQALPPFQGGPGGVPPFGVRAPEVRPLAHTPTLLMTSANSYATTRSSYPPRLPRRCRPRLRDTRSGSPARPRSHLRRLSRPRHLTAHGSSSPSRPLSGPRPLGDHADASRRPEPDRSLRPQARAAQTRRPGTARPLRDAPARQ